MRALLLALLAPSLLAQSLTLMPIADATTDSRQPAANFGTSPQLDFGKFSSSRLTRGHVQFDVTSLLGSGLVPTRATFHWYQSSANGAGCLDVSLHRLLAPWTESGVTWQTQPAFDPVEESRACVGNTFSLGWKQFDVTSLVQRWLAGAVPDFGFVVRDPMEITAGASRPGIGHSREYANPALHPYLELEFADAFGNACTTQTALPAFGVVGGAAIMGRTLTFGATGFAPNSIALAFFGLDSTQWNGTPLPFSLAAIGFPNCDLNVEPGVALTIGLVTSATTTLSITVPTSPPFSGMSLYAQAFAITPTGGLEASNGLGFRVWE